MTISLKNKILESLEDIKAVNPVAINVKKLSTLTDFMIVASGTSMRHITAISEKVIEGLKQNKLQNRNLLNFLRIKSCVKNVFRSLFEKYDF